MELKEILSLSEAIVKRAKVADLGLGANITEEQPLGLKLKPGDPRYSQAIIELDPKDGKRERVAGVYVSLADPEDAPWEALKKRFGEFHDEADYSGWPDGPITRVATVRPDRSSPQTLRIEVDEDGKVRSFLVREYDE